METQPPQPPSDMTYEEARDELVRIVKSLESGQTPLEETLKLWERGEALAARCNQILSEAEQRIERAKESDSSSQQLSE